MAGVKTRDCHLSLIHIFSWAKTKYGGYSYANAVEFSTQQAQRLGWDSYGAVSYTHLDVYKRQLTKPTIEQKQKEAYKNND